MLSGVAVLFGPCLGGTLLLCWTCKETHCSTPAFPREWKHRACLFHCPFRCPASMQGVRRRSAAAASSKPACKRYLLIHVCVFCLCPLATSLHAAFGRGCLLFLLLLFLWPAVAHAQVWLIQRWIFVSDQDRLQIRDAAIENQIPLCCDLIWVPLSCNLAFNNQGCSGCKVFLTVHNIQRFLGFVPILHPKCKFNCKDSWRRAHCHIKCSNPRTPA